MQRPVTSIIRNDPLFVWLVQEEVVDSSLEFLILASDGLWDVVTNEVKRETFRHQKIKGSRKAAHLKLSIWLQEAVGMVKPILDSEQAAKRLLAEASQRGSADITCVVVRFMEQHNGLGRATNDQA